MIKKKRERENKRVLKVSFGDTRPDIHNTKFSNHDNECNYLPSPQISSTNWHISC